MATPLPFRISVPDADLLALRAKLAATRLPTAFPSKGLPAYHTPYGADYAVLEDLWRYWLEGYDWRKHEAELNSFANFKLNVHGLDMHFIHEVSPDPSAVPLVLVHGWPGSIWEFHKIIPGLVRGAKGKSFHIVAPSLPGYAWSQESLEPGMDCMTVADIVHALMQKLGYSQYVAQGGDWGGLIVKALAVAYPQHCVAIHTNMMQPRLPSLAPRALALTARVALDLSPLGSFTLSDAELNCIDRVRDYLIDGSGYFAIQGTKPMTLGAGLNDSPVGLLAWILEKLEVWSDCAGDLLSTLDKDEVLTNVMIYWTTNSVASSMRLYKESLTSAVKATPAAMRFLYDYVTVPCGVAVFPKEILMFPSRWLELSCNLKHVSVHARGGHFAAWEQPEALASDMRKFFFEVITFEQAKQLAAERAKGRGDLLENRLVSAGVLSLAGLWFLRAAKL